MNPEVAAVIVVSFLLLAILIGKVIARTGAGHHLSQDTRDTVKLCTGLIATMAALLLGLLVSSAKSGHDARRSQVIQMAAKIMFLDRVLAGYGPEAADARTKLRTAVEEMVEQVWSVGDRPRAETRYGHEEGDEAYLAIESLSPLDEKQKDLRTHALACAVEIAELRVLLLAQSIPSVSLPILVVVVCWLVVIFVSFSLLAPPNRTANASLLVSALSVSGAMFSSSSWISPSAARSRSRRNPSSSPCPTWGSEPSLKPRPM